MKTGLNHLKVVACAVGLALALSAESCSRAPAVAANAPYQADQEAKAHQLMVDMFERVLPAMVSRETVDKNVKLTYDPFAHELAQTVMPFDGASEMNTLKVDKRGGVEASVVGHRGPPGVSLGIVSGARHRCV
jgi:hypothetical protein